MSKKTKSSPISEAEKTLSVTEEKLPTGLVQVKVLVGTLGFEQGTFERGAVFQTVRGRAEQFDKKDVAVSEIE